MNKSLQSALMLCLCFSWLGLSSHAWAETLTVVIENIEAAEGHLMVRVLQGEEEFKAEREAVTAIKQRAIVGAITFAISNLPAGEYGLQVMHDQNDNGKLDSNFIGIPTEPWAFSNNATGKMGPPSWEDVKFQLTDSVTQAIRLNH